MKTIFHFPANKMKAASIFAAAKDIRYYLNGIAFQRFGDGMVALATDGHRLTVVHEANAGLTDGGECLEGFELPPAGFSVIVSTADIARVVKAHDARDGCPVFVEVETVAEGPRVVRFKCDGGVECKEVEGKAIDWQRVIPLENGPGSVPFEPSPFNADYVADYAKLSRAMGLRHHSIRINARGNSSALVDIGHEDCLCVLMPMMADRSVRAWYFKPTTEEVAEELAEAA